MAIQYRKGQCSECPEGVEKYIVKRLPSGNYCKEHNEARLALTKDTYYPDKKKVPRKLRRKPTGERLLFETILATRKHVSWLTGKKLTQWDIDKYKCCAHVLAKGKWPKFRLLDRNIVLLTAIEHQLYDQGTEQQRQQYQKDNPECDWQKLFTLAEDLRQTYPK